MKPSELAQQLKACIEAGVSTIIKGIPGFGKTSITRQVADEVFGDPTTGGASYFSTVDADNETEPAYFRRFVPSTADPIDLRGVPAIEKVGKRSVTLWAQPSFLPTTGRGIFLIDELGQASPAMQNVLMGVLLDGVCSGHPMAKGWVRFATTNRAEDRANSRRLPTTTMSRAVTLNLDPDVDDFLKWAQESGRILPEFCSYLRFKDKHFNTFDPKSDDPFACARTWELASRLYPVTADALKYEVLSGVLGEGVVADLLSFVKNYLRLPNLDQVLTDPAKVVVPTDAGVLWALAGALAKRAQTADAKQLNNLMTYVARIPNEFAFKSFMDVKHSLTQATDRQRASETIAKLPAVRTWIASDPSAREMLLAA